MNIIVNQKSSQFCDPSLWHERAPPTMSPSPLSASFIGHKCEWTHYVWMSGLSAEEPGSSPPTRRPPLSPIGQPPPLPPHPSLLDGAGPGVRLNVSRVRENGRMRYVCEYAWLWREKRNTNDDIWRETQQHGNAKVAGKKFGLLNEADPQISERKNSGKWEEGKKKITKI